MAEGEIETIFHPPTSFGDRITQTDEIVVPAGKYIEIFGFQTTGSGVVPTGGSLFAQSGDKRLTLADKFQPLGLKVFSGPITLVAESGFGGSLILSYRIRPNAVTESEPVKPELQKLSTDETSLLLDYAVSPNSSYNLGISKDLKTWEPLFEFVTDSDQLKIKVPKTDLGDKAFLRLE